MKEDCEGCIYHDSFSWACCNGESEYRADFVNCGCEHKELKMDGRDEVWLKSMCKILAKCLRNIGDQFDIKSD